MQLSGNKGGSEILPASLMDLRRGDEAVLSEIDLPVEDARRLMELGFSARSACGGRAKRAGRRSAGVSGGWIGNRGAARNRAASQNPP